MSLCVRPIKLKVNRSLDFPYFFTSSHVSVIEKDWHDQIFNKKSWGRDTVQKGVNNGAFRQYLEMFTLNCSTFWPERGSYSPRYVCKVWNPVKIFFVNYGQKVGQNGPKLDVSGYKSKRLIQIFLILGWKKIFNRYDFEEKGKIGQLPKILLSCGITRHNDRRYHMDNKP